jgi:rSAM/selenodomain-associated transferase 1
MMVRYPEPGKVKSRLAAATGDETAADIYRSCAGRLFAAVEGLPKEIDRCLYCADAGDMERIGKWAGNGFGIDAQRGDGLGERLDQGFTTSFNQGAVKTVIVASDVPGISSSILREAFDALDRHDIVIGPSLDGGYYLIGLKRPEPRLFRNIDWSTPTVLDRTLQTAKECGLNPCVLPVLLDIDTADDWHRWIESQKESNEVGCAKTR